MRSALTVLLEFKAVLGRARAQRSLSKHIDYRYSGLHMRLGKSWALPEAEP